LAIIIARKDGTSPDNSYAHFANNKSAIALASNPEYNARIKHVNIQFRYIREKAANATVEFKYQTTRRDQVHKIPPTEDRKIRWKAQGDDEVYETAGPAEHAVSTIGECCDRSKDPAN
jgi:hypothetical protein